MKQEQTSDDKTRLPFAVIVLGFSLLGAIGTFFIVGSIWAFNWTPLLIICGGTGLTLGLASYYIKPVQRGLLLLLELAYHT